MRKHLMRDFNQIYHLDLHGNIRRNPKLSGTTHNVFGIQVGIGITIAVQSYQHANRTLHYYRVPEDWTKLEKLSFLEDRKNAFAIDWLNIVPDSKYNWPVQSLPLEFNSFLPLGTKEIKASRLVESSDIELRCLFRKYSVGIHTARDRWVYNFDKARLAIATKMMIETYNLEIARWINEGCPQNIDDFVLADETKIKWSNTLKMQLARRSKAQFDITATRSALYRPFCKQYLYFDSIMIDRRGLFAQIFPGLISEQENKVIVLSDHGHRSPFSVLMTNVMPDLHLLASTDAFQCFPYYTYAEDGSNRRENITDWALEQFRARYGAGVSKWDIFHYVYALLHHPGYRERYAENLKRDLPHLPLLRRAEAFQSAVRLGKALMDLHVHYEQQEEYPLTPLEDETVPYERLTYVEKMKLTPDRTALIVSKGLTLAGIPESCWRYRLGNRSALEWVIDQYQITKDARSGITSNPNRVDDPEYIARLVKQVVTVSVQTVALVDELAQAVTMENWLDAP